ncbi:MAG TPA: hypothetical protein PLJ60_21190 [Chryseolinea sp.]|jgi:hypothetical protein|nr:hypothetical protein [Chryseolinea sp.]HPM32862.1 hypothetical protein [Chryseolinea sp.]
MTRLILSSIILIILFQACSQKEVRQEQIIGRYVKEVEFEVQHPFTDRKLGRGMIRDTIFILPKQNGYEIVNNKWRKNEYDTLGWQNLQHEDNHPMPTYRATFDPTDTTLNPELSGLFLSLKIDLVNNRLRKGKSKRNVYMKVN